jgi:YfiH family protein
MDVGELRIISPDWPAPRGVRAAFTLRTGGVSTAPYNSLNLGAGIGDSAEAVAENRRRVGEWLQLPSEPVWLEQVHGIVVVDVDEDVGVEPRRVRSVCAESATGGTGLGAPAVAPRADACVARRTGRVCAVRVADCMPVLFAARDGSAVGAAHAGWRGLAAGVLESTIQRLGVAPAQLIAWMGPAIGPAHFEVGDDVRAAFVAADAGAEGAFVANARGRWQCDLYALARRRLSGLGVTNVYGGGWCTHADAGRFFSYRRDGKCGRMAALIWIQPDRLG